MSQENEVQISVSGLPEKTLQQIDAIADREHRPRNRQIVKWLEEAVAEEVAKSGMSAKPARKAA